MFFFLLFSLCYGPVRTRRSYFHSSVGAFTFSTYTRNETIHNVSAYKPEQLPNTARTDSVSWYMPCILTRDWNIANFLSGSIAILNRMKLFFICHYTLENRLIYLNTKFQKREGKLWTYTYANSTKTQIDYIFINKKLNNSTLNCEAYFSFEGVSSDRRIVTVKIWLILRSNTIRKTTIEHYDGALLNNRGIRDKYALTLRNKFDALKETTETHNPNEEYENFVHAHLEAAVECIPTKQRAKPRISWETLAVRKKRADVKTATKCNRKNPTNTSALKLKKDTKWIS